jgi:hypothetical protein
VATAAPRQPDSAEGNWLLRELDEFELALAESLERAGR